MKIIVDADACPVKDFVAEVATKYDVDVVMICSIAHYSNKQYGQAKWIFVDSYAQSADLVIMNESKRGDVVVTQDYGLASMLLSKGCRVIHHTGYEYTEENIEELLFRRHLSSKIRKAGGRTKGPKPLSAEEKNRFYDILVKVVIELKQE